MTIGQIGIAEGSLLVALVEQPSGHEGAMVYRVWTEGNNYCEVDRFTFYRIMDAAGEAVHPETGVWEYDNAPIVWGDVFVDGRGL